MKPVTSSNWGILGTGVDIQIGRIAPTHQTVLNNNSINTTTQHSVKGWYVRVCTVTIQYMIHSFTTMCLRLRCLLGTEFKLEWDTSTTVSGGGELTKEIVVKLSSFKKNLQSPHPLTLVSQFRFSSKDKSPQPHRLCQLSHRKTQIRWTKDSAKYM